MSNKLIFLTFILILGMGFISYKISYSFFSDAANSTSNIFAAASIFPTPTPTISPTPQGSPTPTPQACSGTIFASSVVSNTIGTLKNNNPITDPNRINPNNSLGVNNWVVGTGTNFYSLGKLGSLTLIFSSPILNVPGFDLTFYEATNGRLTYPEEKIDVEVSNDGTTYLLAGSVTSEPGVGGDGVVGLDFSSTGLGSVNFIRLTETTNFTPHTADADGYDLDAVSGFCSQPS